MEDIFGILIFIAFWGAVIAIIVNKKKKKKNSQKRQKNYVEIFMEKINNCHQVEFPEYYFEKLYFSFDKSEDPIEQKIKTFSDYFIGLSEGDAFNKYIESLKLLETKCASFSLFVRNKEELDRYNTENKNVPNLDEQISYEIALSLKFYKSLRAQWKNFAEAANAHFAFSEHRKHLFLGMLLMFEEGRNEQEESDYQSSLITFNETYNFALNQQWNDIILDHPDLDTPTYKEIYFNLAEKEISRTKWLKTFEEKFFEIDSKIGFPAFEETLLNFLKEMEQFVNKSFFLCIRDGFNEYSSVYEIEDFSEEEILRIVDLYKQKVIVGAYSKSKDPKYQ